ncbi:L,D-transpeptidase family protein [Phenylobacterium sp.]|uniref:L,D-transpeptidase family protein n=1 Tax=Phenylobacterium sp. TaxID=1871053 RepID=UPI0039C946D1
MIFTATANSGVSTGWMEIAGRRVRCALGKSGVKPAKDKREGDLASPAGIWPIRRVFYRPDRGGPPRTALPLVSMAPDDGWCDDPHDAAYNRLVKLPRATSHENLWREDHVYDLVVILGHNDDPPEPGMGSAIFLHLAREDYAPTEGCVALARSDLEELLAAAHPGDALEIRAG